MILAQFNYSLFTIILGIQIPLCSIKIKKKIVLKFLDVDFEGTFRYLSRVYPGLMNQYFTILSLLMIMVGFHLTATISGALCRSII